MYRSLTCCNVQDTFVLTFIMFYFVIVDITNHSFDITIIESIIYNQNLFLPYKRQQRFISSLPLLHSFCIYLSITYIQTFDCIISTYFKLMLTLFSNILKRMLFYSERRCRFYARSSSSVCWLFALTAAFTTHP